MNCISVAPIAHALTAISNMGSCINEPSRYPWQQLFSWVGHGYLMLWHIQ